MTSPIKAFRQKIFNLKNRNERSLNIKKNIFLSFVLRGFSFASNFLLVPITIHYLNPDKYGIWLTLSSIIGWFGLFDIGLGHGLRNKLAESLAVKNYELGRIYVSTSFAFLSIVITVLLFVFIISNSLLNWSAILNAPTEMSQELSIVAVFVFVFFSIQFVLRLISTVLTADQKPVINDLLNVSANILSLIIIYLLSFFTTDSLLLVAIIFSSAPVIVFLIAYFIFFYNQYSYLRPSIKHINFSYVKDLMGLGIQFFIIQIASLVIYSTSNIIILKNLGAEQVTIYNIAFKYFSIISITFTIIVTPLWSAFTQAYIINDYNWIKSIIKRMNQLWLITVFITILMIFMANHFYRFWIGDKIKIPELLNYTSAIYVIISNYGSIYMMFLNGVGKLRIQLIGIIISSILFFPLATYLSNRMGVSGVVLAGAIAIFVYVFLAPIQYKKIITNTAKGIWNL